MIHPTAILDPSVTVGDGVEIGPYCVIGAGVSIAAGARLLSHVVLSGPTVVGARVVIHPFAVVGGAPQDRSHRGEPTTLEIGAETEIREGVTVHRGTAKDRGRTVIGSKVLLMAGSHVAHDVVIADGCTIANGSLLAGHCVLEEGVAVGGAAAIAPFVRVGAVSFVAAGARVEQDVPPFHIVTGDRARIRTVNVVGLRRQGIGEGSRAALLRAHRAIYRSGLPIEVAAAALDQPDGDPDPHVRRLVTFLRERTTVPGPSAGSR